MRMSAHRTLGLPGRSIPTEGAQVRRVMLTQGGARPGRRVLALLAVGRGWLPCSSRGSPWACPTRTAQRPARRVRDRRASLPWRRCRRPVDRRTARRPRRRRGDDRPGRRAQRRCHPRTSASRPSTGHFPCSSATCRCSSACSCFCTWPGNGPLVLRIGGDSADHSFWMPKKPRTMPGVGVRGHA